MNEKWFNYAISLTIMMIFVNAFITIGASQLNADGSSNLFLMNSTNNALTYSNQKSNSDFYTTDCSNGTNSSQSPTDAQGCVPIKRTIDDNPVSFNSFDAAVIMVFGIELVMTQLSQIFWPVAPLFMGIAAIAFFIKSIAMAWLSSIVIRAILGRLS